MDKSETQKELEQFVEAYNKLVGEQRELNEKLAQLRGIIGYLSEKLKAEKGEEPEDK